MGLNDIFILNWWYTLIRRDRKAAIRVLLVTLCVGVLGAAAAAWQAMHAAPFTQVRAVVAVYPVHFKFLTTPYIQTLQRPRNDARNMTMVMAKGANVINEVIRRMGDKLPEEWQDPAELSKYLAVRGGEGVYVYLTVNAPNPDLGYALATTWAKVVEEEAERSFYRYDSDIPLLDSQIQETAKKIETVDAALEKFRRETGIGLIDESRVAVIVRDAKGLAPGLGGFSARTMELGNVNGTLADYRHAQATLRYLAEEVRRAEQDGRPLVSVPLELVETLRPVQTRGRVTLENLRALGDNYEAVATALEQEANDLQPAIDFLSKRSDTLQGALSADITKLRNLLRERDSVETLYRALLAKREELRAEAAVSSNLVEVVEVREQAISRALGLLLHAIAGAILGGFLGFIVATTWYYVRTHSPPSTTVAA